MHLQSRRDWSNWPIQGYPCLHRILERLIWEIFGQVNRNPQGRASTNVATENVDCLIPVSSLPPVYDPTVAPMFNQRQRMLYGAFTALAALQADPSRSANAEFIVTS